MEKFDIYKDISQRTKGDIYIGVVGPVRTGKSTFIKKFMDLLVIPNISDENVRRRAIDELPQSGSGRVIMTTEPKFIPNESVEITINDELNLNVRMIDCVGYVVEGAEGHIDGLEPRMISTPWSEAKMPFTEAAEFGTKKVIQEHSTIGIVVTTDGSVTNIERESYVTGEEKVIYELEKLGKPYVIVLNTDSPYSEHTEELVLDMQDKYKVPVVPLNCAQIKEEDIHNVLEKVLYEFPVTEVKFMLPKWVEVLHNDNWLKNDLISEIKNTVKDIKNIGSINSCVEKIGKCEHIKKIELDKINLGVGVAGTEISIKEELFYGILSETTGLEIKSEYELISNLKILADAKKEYDKIKGAIDAVERSGYGIVTPSLEEMVLGRPEIVKHGSRYGVKIKASAPSMHLIKVDVETEISPIIGSEEQSLDLIRYLTDKMDTEEMDKVWELNMFGKTMQELVKDGLQSKIHHMPDDAQMKFQESLKKIINTGSGGLICILL